jgi:hypothetical protein
MAVTISETVESKPEYFGIYGMMGYKDMEARGDSADDVYVAPRQLRPDGRLLRRGGVRLRV